MLSLSVAGSCCSFPFSLLFLPFFFHPSFILYSPRPKTWSKRWNYDKKNSKTKTIRQETSTIARMKNKKKETSESFRDISKMFLLISFLCTFQFSGQRWRVVSRPGVHLLCRRLLSSLLIVQRKKEKGKTKTRKRKRTWKGQGMFRYNQMFQTGNSVRPDRTKESWKVLKNKWMNKIHLELNHCCDSKKKRQINKAR